MEINTFVFEIQPFDLTIDIAERSFEAVVDNTIYLSRFEVPDNTNVFQMLDILAAKLVPFGIELRFEYDQTAQSTEYLKTISIERRVGRIFSDSKTAELAANAKTGSRLRWTWETRSPSGERDRQGADDGLDRLKKMAANNSGSLTWRYEAVSTS